MTISKSLSARADGIPVERDQATGFDRDVTSDKDILPADLFYAAQDLRLEAEKIGRRYERLAAQLEQRANRLEAVMNKLPRGKTPTGTADGRANST